MFKNGLKDGQGTQFSVNGNKYIGAWKQDFMHGVGIFFCGRENYKRQGEWREGKRVAWVGPKMESERPKHAAL